MEKETYLRDLFLAFISLQCSFMANLALKYVDILEKSPKIVQSSTMVTPGLAHFYFSVEIIKLKAEFGLHELAVNVKLREHAQPIRVVLCLNFTFTACQCKKPDQSECFPPISHLIVTLTLHS